MFDRYIQFLFLGDHGEYHDWYQNRLVIQRYMIFLPYDILGQEITWQNMRISGFIFWIYIYIYKQPAIAPTNPNDACSVDYMVL